MIAKMFKPLKVQLAIVKEKCPIKLLTSKPELLELSKGLRVSYNLIVNNLAEKK